MRGTFPDGWSLPETSLVPPVDMLQVGRTLTNAGEGILVSGSESRHRITLQPASHIQQFRYVSHLRSRNRGAATLLQLWQNFFLHVL